MFMQATLLIFTFHYTEFTMYIYFYIRIILPIFTFLWVMFSDGTTNLTPNKWHRIWECLKITNKLWGLCQDWSRYLYLYHIIIIFIIMNIICCFVVVVVVCVFLRITWLWTSWTFDTDASWSGDPDEATMNFLTSQKSLDNKHGWKQTAQEKWYMPSTMMILYLDTIWSGFFCHLLGCLNIFSQEQRFHLKLIFGRWCFFSGCLLSPGPLLVVSRKVWHIQWYEIFKTYQQNGFNQRLPEVVRKLRMDSLDFERDNEFFGASCRCWCKLIVKSKGLFPKCFQTKLIYTYIYICIYIQIIALWSIWLVQYVMVCDWSSPFHPMTLDSEHQIHWLAMVFHKIRTLWLGLCLNL